MAEELVKLTNQNDEFEEKVKEIPKLRAQLKVRWNKYLSSSVNLNLNDQCVF